MKDSLTIPGTQILQKKSMETIVKKQENESKIQVTKRNKINMRKKVKVKPTSMQYANSCKEIGEKKVKVKPR